MFFRFTLFHTLKLRVVQAFSCFFFTLFSVFTAIHGCASAASPYIIAITQIAPHPSLDAIREGLVDEIKTQHPDAKIIIENAQGDLSIATQIAQRFIGLNPDVIIPITTPSAQTVYNAVQGQDIPVIFAGVSDPVAAKLISSFHEKGKNITGVADVLPLGEQLNLIRNILPNIKKIGTIYNAGEANSQAFVEKLEFLCAEHHIELITVAVTNTATVAAASLSLAGKVDAIFIGNDNTVISALQTVLKVSRTQKLPVFSADPESVQAGCLAALAPSQYKMGQQVGRMVNRCLGRKRIDDIPVEVPETIELSVNLKTADAFGISIPASLLTHANLIKD